MVTTHGGARPGAGRPAVYPQKARETFAMALTRAGRDRLARVKRRTGLGQNDIMEHLLRLYPTIDVPRNAQFTPKLYPPVAIRLTTTGGVILLEAQARTGRSWTDIGEALLLEARDTVFPLLEAVGKPKDARRGRHAATRRP